MSDFPNKLKKLRTDSHLTQKQLAGQLNVSQNAVYNWENGKREPNLDMMKKIAKIFDIALYILLDDKYELPDINNELEKNRARFVGDTELIKPPHFTCPLNNDQSLKGEIDKAAINIDILDDFKFERLIQKLNRGESLTAEEINFHSEYLEKSLKKIGDIFAKFYVLLNEEGRKKADEQILRTIEQLELLSKVPQYQKKPDENK